MIPRHPALSVELRNEADDLRRYARELDASGDAEGAAAVRDQSMHVDEWVDAVVELEADSAELRELLELVDGADTPGKLASRIAELESEAEGLEDVAAEVKELRARLKDRTSELDDATRERDELERRVEELREVVTRELRADAVERIAELESERDELKRRVEELERRPAVVDYNALRTSPKGSDARDCYLRAQAFNEVVDFLPIPAKTVETVRRAIDGTIEHADRLDALREIARAMTAEAGKASADPSDNLRVALVDLLDALEAVDREDNDAYPRLEAAIKCGRSATGTERPEPAVVDSQGAAREALRLAIAQREEARAALATLNADHPLQLAYEAELEAELRRVKPKGKIPRLDNGRLDVVAASAKLPDGGHAIRDRYAVEVKRISEELDTAHTAAVDAVVAAALDVTPRTTDGARTLLADVWASTYSTQTAPELYARGMIAIEAKTAYANCPGVALDHEEVRNARGDITALRLYGNVEPLDAEAIRIKGLELPERVRLAYASGCNPRVYWPTLPHGYEERHGLDRFGGRTVTP